MTTRDYAKIADVLFNIKPSSTDIECWESLVQAFCEMLKRDNVRFNDALFRDACYGEK